MIALVLLILSLTNLVTSVPHNQTSLLPIVIYRGFDSSCCNGTALHLARQINSTFPTAIIHFIQLSTDPERDRLHSVFGNAADQVWMVAQQLKADTRLREGFTGIGISQGGILLRDYVQRFNDPPCRRLITLGSPHAGIETAPSCDDFNFSKIMNQILPFTHGWMATGRFACRIVRKTLMEAANTSFFQEFILPAQYYRNATFLTNINNWGDKKNQTFIHHLESLDWLVLYMFEQDQVVIPADSAWFSLQSNDTVKPQNITDSLGLYNLRSKGKLILRNLPGKHLALPDDFVSHHIGLYINGTAARSS